VFSVKGEVTVEPPPPEVVERIQLTEPPEPPEILALNVTCPPSQSVVGDTELVAQVGSVTTVIVPLVQPVVVELQGEFPTLLT